MPTYGCECEECTHVFERNQKVSDEPLKSCPKCGGRVHKLFYPVGLVFKGPGFHITDYCRPNDKAESSAAPEKPETAAKDAGAKSAEEKVGAGEK